MEIPAMSSYRRAYWALYFFAAASAAKSLFDKSLPQQFHGLPGDADRFRDFDVGPFLVCQKQRLSAFSFLCGVLSFIQKVIQDLDFLIGKGDVITFVRHGFPPAKVGFSQKDTG